MTGEGWRKTGDEAVNSLIRLCPAAASKEKSRKREAPRSNLTASPKGRGRRTGRQREDARRARRRNNELDEMELRRRWGSHSEWLLRDIVGNNRTLLAELPRSCTESIVTCHPMFTLCSLLTVQ